MKTLAVLMIAVSSLVTGCVVADPSYRGDGRGDRDGARYERDRDSQRGESERDRYRQDRRDEELRRD